MNALTVSVNVSAFVLGKLVKEQKTKAGELNHYSFVTRGADGERFWANIRGDDNKPLSGLKPGQLVGGILSGVETVVVPAKGDKPESTFKKGFLRVLAV